MAERPREFRLTVDMAGLPKLGPVQMLACVDAGQLYAAPLGSPPFRMGPPDGLGAYLPWVLLGPVDDLPKAHHYLGDVAAAYWAAAAGG